MPALHRRFLLPLLLQRLTAWDVGGDGTLIWTLTGSWAFGNTGFSIDNVCAGVTVNVVKACRSTDVALQRARRAGRDAGRCAPFPMSSAGNLLSRTLYPQTFRCFLPCRYSKPDVGSRPATRTTGDVPSNDGLFPGRRTQLNWTLALLPMAGAAPISRWCHFLRTDPFTRAWPRRLLDGRTRDSTPPPTHFLHSGDLPPPLRTYLSRLLAPDYYLTRSRGATTIRQNLTLPGRARRHFWGAQRCTSRSNQPISWL